jgi:hypothetical protein
MGNIRRAVFTLLLTGVVISALIIIGLWFYYRPAVEFIK